MNSKGTSVWEQYIEYVVLGIAVLVLGWFAWGVVSSSIQVKSGSLVVTTSNVNEELLTTAKKLDPKLKDGTPSPMEFDVYVSMLDDYKNQASQSISPSNRVAFPTVDMTAGIDLNQQVQSELRMYVQPTILAPEDARTQQWFGTIAESEFQRVEELADAIAGPPHDTTWVQVAARFDVDEVIASFSNSAEGEEPIPSQWFDEGADIFDVVVERQTLGETGWSLPEVISVLPGHLTYRDELQAEEINAMERESIIRDLRSGKQGDIANPDFYQLKGAIPTTMDSPSSWDGEIQIEEDSPTSDLERLLKRTERKIDQQGKKIKAIEERIEREKSGGRGGGGGGSPLGGGGSSGGNNNAKLDRLQVQLNRAIDELNALLQEKIDLEIEIDEILNQTDTEELVIMSGDVWVWAHDMNAFPGETYRYRMSVHVSNPFFGHKPSLYPQQKPLADSVTLASATSIWTPKIEIQKPLQWFLLTATQSGQSISPDALDSGRVSAEIFEFKDGAWTSNVIGVPVGQRLGQPKPDGFSSDWFVLDILEDVSGEIILLQHVDNGEVQIINPFEQANSYRLAQLRQQVKNQTSVIDEDEEDESTMPPGGRPLGGGGGGGGGAF